MKNKPSNLKYTDLCIYIDNTVYERDENNNPIKLKKMTPYEEEKVYNYLYNLIGALTYKNKYFLNPQDREDFIFDFSTETFLRLTNPKQDFSKDFRDKTNKRRLSPIKSVLNYIKGILNFSIMDYRNLNYKETLDPNYNSQEEILGCKEMLEEQIRSTYQQSYQELLLEQFKLLPIYLKEILDNSIYNTNLLTRNCLELSILLTISNFMTISNKYKNYSINKKIFKLKSQLNEWKNNVIIWQEDRFITKEIVILYVQKLFSKIYEETSKEERDSYIPENVVEEILNSARPTYGINHDIGD